MLKLKAALLTLMWVLVCFTIVGLAVYAVKFYGLHMLFAVSLSIIGAIMGFMIYCIYSHILQKLKHGL